MTIEDDIAFLERVPILRRLGAGALRILAIGAESYSVQAGQVLFTAGEAADGAYVVQHGSFSLSTERGDEPEVIAGPGTLLGESALLTETKRPATAGRARTPPCCAFRARCFCACSKAIRTPRSGCAN